MQSKYFYLLLLILFLSNIILGQTVNLNWRHTFGNAGGANYGTSVTTDSFGNVYHSGTFQNTIDFDPGIGVTNLTSYLGGSQMYIAKYDSNGIFIWAKTLAPSSSGNLTVFLLDATPLCIDHSGFIYLSGAFNGTIDFDMGPGISNLSSTGTSAFILKLDTSGNYVWVKKLECSVNMDIYSMKLDNQHNIYSSGRFQGTIDFDPGSAVVNKVSNGDNDIFISKLDSNGNYIYGKSIGGIGNDYVTSIAAGDFGNLYLTGSVTGVVDLDPGPGNFTLAASSPPFILKLNNAGDFVWAKNIGWTYRIGLDQTENIIACRNFPSTGGSIDIDPGPGIANVNCYGSATLCISKYDSACNFLWAKSVSGNLSTSEVLGVAVEVDDTGNVYAAGEFYNGTFDFNTDPPVLNFTLGNSTGLYLMKLNSSGTFMWANYISGANATGLELGSISKRNSNVNITGSFYGMIDFDPGIATLNTNPSGIYDVFLLSYKEGSSIAVNTVNFNQNKNRVQIYPNPTSSILNILHPFTTSKLKLKIMDALGRLVYEKEMNAINPLEITTKELQTGIYQLLLSNGSEQLCTKFFKRE